MRYTLRKQSHAIFALTYHYICVVKYRRKVFINEGIKNRLKEINFDIAEKFNIQIINQETDFDHLHLLFSTTPQVEFPKFINTLIL